jgi:predicted permease
MLNVFATLGVLLASGIIYRMIPGVPTPQTVRSVIGSIVLNVFIPLLAFEVLATEHIMGDVWTVPVASVATTLIGFGLAFLVYGYILRKRIARPTIGAMILAATWCNAMYLGLPITLAVVGDPGDHVPILFDYAGMTPLLFTLGTAVCVAYGTSDEQPTFRQGIKQILRLPPFIATVAGIAVNAMGLELPLWFIAAAETAGKVVAPLMLFSIGLTLRWPTISRTPMLVPAAVIRTIIVPLLVFPLASLLHPNDDILRSTMLEAAMPSMMLPLVFAERYGLDVESLAEAILLSTIISVATLPIVASWPL